MKLSHTPGPWKAGRWSGRCMIAEHGFNHPGPDGGCVYTPLFYPMEEGGSFAGIVTEDPKVSVIWTEYNELKMRPADACLIAAAPDLLAALKAFLAIDDVIYLEDAGPSGEGWQSNELAGVFNAANAAIAKAEGR